MLQVAALQVFHDAVQASILRAMNTCVRVCLSASPDTEVKVGSEETDLRAHTHTHNTHTHTHTRTHTHICKNNINKHTCRAPQRAKETNLRVCVYTNTTQPASQTGQVASCGVMHTHRHTCKHTRACTHIHTHALALNVLTDPVTPSIDSMSAATLSVAVAVTAVMGRPGNERCIGTGTGDTCTDTHTHTHTRTHEVSAGFC